MSLFSWMRRLSRRRPAPARKRPTARPSFEALENRTLPTAFTLFAAGTGPGGGSEPANAELWRTDGTPGGTKLVKDIRRGINSSDPRDITFIPQMNRWFFTADDGVHGRELWTSNGTAKGTKMVRDIFVQGRVPYNGMDRNTAPFFTYCNGFVYFVANGGPGQGGIELWRTNGTKGGTRLVADIKHREEGSVPAKLTAVGNKLFFVADDGFTQRELWVTDGSAAGTHLVKDIWPGNVTSGVQRLTNVNGKLFFVADDGVHGKELWTSDGTAAGTYMVKDINAVRVSNAYSSDPRWLVNFQGKCYFAADDGIHGRELWASDGTAAGTYMVKDIVPEAFDEFGESLGNTGSNPANLTVMNGTLYFSTLSVTAPSGSGLYRSDGTAAGTVLIKQINNDAVDSEEPYAVHLEPMRFTVVGSQLFFIAGTHKDWVSATNENVELWRTDGTAAGTYQVMDIFPFNFGSSKPSKLREVNGKLFFFAYTEDFGREPWVSGGTAATTQMLKDINPTRGPGTSLGADSETYARSFGQYQYE